MLGLQLWLLEHGLSSRGVCSFRIEGCLGLQRMSVIGGLYNSSFDKMMPGRTAGKQLAERARGCRDPALSSTSRSSGYLRLKQGLQNSKFSNR